MRETSSMSMNSGRRSFGVSPQLLRRSPLTSLAVGSGGSSIAGAGPGSPPGPGRLAALARRL
jgi:hypothetical protein